MSASLRTIPGFFASSPRINLSLFLLGCKSCNATAEELCPINARTSIFPVFIIGEAIFLPLPNKIFTTPGGNASLKASKSGVISSTPNLAGLKMAVFPIISAGINKENVSLRG